MERDVEPAGDELGEHLVVVPRTVALERAGGVVPVAHEESDDFMSLLLQQVCSHRGVDASGKTYHYTCHFRNVFFGIRNRDMLSVSGMQK